MMFTIHDFTKKIIGVAMQHLNSNVKNPEETESPISKHKMTSLSKSEEDVSLTNK
jgi:hypothetical protein